MSNSAKLSARERIESLVDANSFVEIGGMITKRNTDFNMQEKAVPADGDYRLRCCKFKSGLYLQSGCNRLEWFCR